MSETLTKDKYQSQNVAINVKHVLKVLIPCFEYLSRVIDSHRYCLILSVMLLRRDISHKILNILISFYANSLRRHSRNLVPYFDFDIPKRKIHSFDSIQTKNQVFSVQIE